MQNLTENLKNLEPVSFARGGFAVVHKAILYPEGLFRRRIAGLLSFSDCVFPLPLSREVAVKFPDVRSIAGGVDAECIADRTKILQRWRREITAGQSVSHPNILPFLGFCENPDPKCKEFVGIVLPFCKNGNASSYLQQHTRVDRMRILVPVAAALFALHYRSSPVVHGDIKASNILIDEHGDPLLADFGLSRVCNTIGFTTKHVMGSTRWMSAELLRALTASFQNGTSADDQIVRTTRASDIWAFAMTILEVLTGKAPFTEYTFDGGVLFNVVTNKARPRKPHDPQISDATWALLERCWEEEPATRPDARHVGLALDIIYGFGRREVDSHTVSAILAGALDNVVPQSSQSQRLESALLPYQCKWLHCSRSFDRIDDCIEHECAEFTRRCAANGR